MEVASRVSLLILVTAIAIAALAPGTHAAAYSDKLLLISYDGFRYDYLDKVNTPNFDYLASKGVKAPYINGTFITRTFPSHYTIVTGRFI